MQTLQHQIRQREQELEALRRELQSRQTQLDNLLRRKQGLQSQLQEVEAEIATLATTPVKKAPGTPAASSASPLTDLEGRAEDQPKLSDLIVAALRRAGQPRTARQLLEEVQKRGYQPSGRDPIKSIDARIAELKNRGLIRRAPDQPGYVLASSVQAARKEERQISQPVSKQTPKAITKPSKPVHAAKKRRAKVSSSAKTAGAANTARPGGQPPLRVVLTNILQNSRKLLSGRELAEQALAAGYKSKSEKFVDTVWAMLTKMANVEHVPDQGYRLKKK
jgi:hypothetical protein